MVEDVKSLYNISTWEALKINYWGIPKAANTSVKYALHKHTEEIPIREPDEITKWVHDKNKTRYISRDDALSNGYQNITVVRHPLGRFESMFKDTQRRGKLFFNRKEQINNVDDLLAYITETNDNRRNVHFKSQSYFIPSKQSIKIFKVESIDILSNYLNIEIQHINKINRDIELTKEQVKKVQELFKKDYELFDYD